MFFNFRFFNTCYRYDIKIARFLVSNIFIIYLLFETKSLLIIFVFPIINNVIRMRKETFSVVKTENYSFKAHEINIILSAIENVIIRIFVSLNRSYPNNYITIYSSFEHYIVNIHLCFQLFLPLFLGIGTLDKLCTYLYLICINCFILLYIFYFGHRKLKCFFSVVLIIIFDRCTFTGDQD